MNVYDAKDMSHKLIVLLECYLLATDIIFCYVLTINFSVPNLAFSIYCLTCVHKCSYKHYQLHCILHFYECHMQNFRN